MLTSFGRPDRAKTLIKTFDRAVISYLGSISKHSGYRDSIPKRAIESLEATRNEAFAGLSLTKHGSKNRAFGLEFD